MPGIALVTSVKVNRIFQWSWNTSGKVRACTFCGDGSGEVNAEGCHEKSLADASITSFGVMGGLGTHEKDGQHGYEQDSILVPERVCSQNEKTWINQIRNTRLYGVTRCTFGENDRRYTKTYERKVVALSEDVHTRTYLACT
jgi:hypothetical protein